MIINIIKKIILGYRADSDSFIKYYREKGVKIGERVTIHEPFKATIDLTRPFLLSIGNDVVITKGVTILTHGYDWNVLGGEYDCVLGSAGSVTIGNNVFVGMNATILKGVTIGDNVIIGANSLVNKNVPTNSVVAGNPAKVICTIEEYYKKRKELQLKEAIEIYTKYVERHNKEPDPEIFDEFFWIFHDRSKPLPQAFIRQMGWHDREKETMQNFLEEKPLFNGYEKFVEYIKTEHKNNKNY